MSVKYDKRPILVKYPLGTSIGKVQNTIYSDWTVIYADKNNPSIDIESTITGKENNFDLVITVDANDLTRQITDKCSLLIDEYPTNNFSVGNFEVLKVFPEFMGTINIGLKSITGKNLPLLYYLNNDGNIYSYQLNYDSIKKQGYINYSLQHPFCNTTKIWFREPVDENDTRFMLEYERETRIGIVYNLNNFKRLEFKEILDA